MDDDDTKLRVWPFVVVMFVITIAWFLIITFGISGVIDGR